MAGPVKVLGVSGGRRFSDPNALGARLDNEAAGYAPEEIVLRHGRCNPRNDVGDVIDWDDALAMLPQEQFVNQMGVASWRR